MTTGQNPQQIKTESQNNFVYHQPYFLQTTEWAEFWKSVNPIGHKFFWHKSDIEISKSDETENITTCETLIYEFPWHLGEKFWYLPKFPLLKQENWENLPSQTIKNLLTIHLKEIVEEAKKTGIAFVKLDVEEGLTHAIGFENNDQLLLFIRENIDQKSQIATKKIQFLQTITLDIRNIPNQNLNNIFETKEKNGSFPVDVLTQFWQECQDFWKATNTNVRRYTKKALSAEWKISTAKTQENFEKFMDVYNQTKERQNFVIHSREYMQTLFEDKNIHIIILTDQQNIPQCVWFGKDWGNTLIYLFGGNTQYSFDNHGQYLMHLTAIYLAKTLSLDFYDLGGYESGTGYGKFKENYKGQLRTFLGPIDIPVKPIWYMAVNKIINLAKIFKK